ncbi:hypothetical protein KX928_08240 [Roseobacter sp. YSTF-M11]|uniref:Isoprenylcysteine carboxyl methyltransferase (ICMT) family protein n=1 Tax=Roseobacter insulae TaxID=2859783 RepID=A0A9X1K1R0_9RHOB|nr:isoprenylcysteine carboxylmethyltransferase family protein [Roseobacter insulae]MBW4707773.1 hypothetical protein [Roseobacter insulae]
MKPTSVASNVSTVIGVLALTTGVIIQIGNPSETKVAAALFLVFCYVIPVALYETLVLKVHKRASTGLDWSKPRAGDPGRVALKLLGFVAVIAAIMAIHSVFRIYSVRRLMDPMVAMIMLAPFVIPMIVLYFWHVDRRMVSPRDGYWHMGAWIVGRNRDPDWPLMKNFVLGWVIKGFFLPVMFAYLAANMPGLSARAGQMTEGPVMAVAYLAKVMVVMELTIVVVGYTMTARLFDAHIRSPNGYLAAWVVTMICYEPFNKVTSGRIYARHTGQSWSDVIGDYQLLFWPWLVLIIASFFVWMWSTAIFGLRWSNLTHRGIITNGPYALSKHPDYVAKSTFFWLTAAPFLTAVTAWTAITATLALVVTNLVYFGRARMEEKHLSEDPDYVAYALEMNRRSIFRPLARWVPYLIYTAPDGRNGLEPEHPGGLAHPAE